MGQDKKQLTKLLAFVKELYDNPDNKEFAAGIESMVLNDLKYRKENSKIDEIYELCIRKFLKEQAEDLYKDFPLVEIAQDLSAFYIEMENARRKNDIDAFGFFLFKQLELITGVLVKDREVVDTFDTLRTQKPFTVYNRDLEGKIRVADKFYNTVEEFILVKDRINDTYSSMGKSLDRLFTIEKIKAIIYIVVNKGDVPIRHEQLNEDFRILQSIYNLRNRYAHNSNNANENQILYYNMIIEDKTKNSLRFLNFLMMFVQGVINNYSKIKIGRAALYPSKIA